MTDQLLTIKEVADRLGLHEQTARRRLQDGTIPYTTKPPKHGNKPQYFVRESDLAAYEAMMNKPSYDDLAKEVKVLRRELLRLANRVEAGTAGSGDIVRARGALGDGGE